MNTKRTERYCQEVCLWSQEGFLDLHRKRLPGYTFLLLFLEIGLEWDNFVPEGEIVKFLGRENTLLEFL